MKTNFFLDERKVLVAIVVNAIVLFALGFDLPEQYARPLNYIDDLITALFIVELVVKVHTWGPRGYLSSNWNRFDLLLILLSLPSLASHFVELRGLDLSYLLVFRVCRVFKFFRFLRFIPGIDQMLAGVMRALRASVMLLLAFFVALFMVSLLSTKLFGAIDPEHYGDPLRSLYSTFKIFTVEGWFEVPDEVASHMSGPAAFFARLFFSFLLLGAGVMGLSLVNSVFVDAMVADNTADLESKVDALHEELRSLRKDLAGRARPAADDPAPPRT
jgi:voltage-gated sodium channel